MTSIARLILSNSLSDFKSKHKEKLILAVPVKLKLWETIISLSFAKGKIIKKKRSMKGSNLRPCG